MSHGYGSKLSKNAPLEHDFGHIFLRFFGKMGDFLLLSGIGCCFGIILSHLNAKNFSLGRHEVNFCRFYTSEAADESESLGISSRHSLSKTLS